MNSLKLSERLFIIAEMVSPGNRTADIGTDHGYIPVYLDKANKCNRIIATDINRKPLEKAILLAEKYHAANIEFRQTDGLSGFEPHEVQTIIIAGMGGDRIAAILSAAKWSHECELILQPMSKREHLGRWLREAGLYVAEEKLVCENGGIHSVMKVEKGRDNDISIAGLYISKHLSESKDVLLYDYLEGIINKSENSLAGIRYSMRTDLAEQSAYYEKLIQELYDIKEKIK